MLIPLTSGAYQSRNLIASAQACINVYPEATPGDTLPPVPVTHYPTPGKVLLATPSTLGAGRGLYSDITGQLYAVIGATVYKISSSWALTSIGTIDNGTSPVSMVDNETSVFLVNGTQGFTWDVDTGASFAQVTDVNFLGSRYVDFLNTYLLFAQPNTPTFYTSLSNTLTFNALYFADITGASSDLVAAIAIHGIVWLIGTYATEIWFDSGDTNVLPFQRMPDMVLHQGCIAPYSVAKQYGIDDTTNAIFWLAQNKEGNTFVTMTHGYSTTRISTNAIEDQFRQYQQTSTITDAIGYCYQQDGHPFYVLSFPQADATWVYDSLTNQWHQRTWLDQSGQRHRDRGQFAAFAYGKVVTLDWETGKLYALDLDTYTDNGDPVERVRTFPHLLNGMSRVVYARFIADMDPGGDQTNSILTQPPLVSLRWSDDRGHSWGNPVRMSLGSTGAFNVSLLWTKLGMARDRVFEISWSVDAKTALNGAYVEPIALAS